MLVFNTFHSKLTLKNFDQTETETEFAGPEFFFYEIQS
jgi:hypothetical protein